MKYAYYPGCSLHSTAKEYDQSARAVCEALDIELVEIPEWICCGASSAHMTSELLSLALPVKNLVLAREMNLDVAVCCAACYSRLRFADAAMSTDECRQASEIDQIVGASYRGEIQAKHLLEIVTSDYGLEALEDGAITPLEGFKVAAYYGCLLVRPPEVVAFDNPENPMVLDELTVALGAEVVAWSHKIECCGASLSLTRTDVVLKLVRDILQAAADAGANCLVVACPLCQSNLDLRQAQVNRQHKTDFDLPILYFTQLIGLALGMEPKALGLNKLIVSPKKLLAAGLAA
jgi:heterodisulfide reductase subunit B